MFRSVALLLASVLPAWAGARLVVYPAQLDLRGVDREHGMLVSRVDDDGRTLDVTRKARFTTSAPAIVALNAQGHALAVADGTGEIEVAPPSHALRPTRRSRPSNRSSPPTNAKRFSRTYSGPC